MPFHFYGKSLLFGQDKKEPPWTAPHQWGRILTLCPVGIKKKHFLCIFFMLIFLFTWRIARLGRHGTSLTRSASLPPATLRALSTRPALVRLLTQCSMWSSNWALLRARLAWPRSENSPPRWQLGGGCRAGWSEVTLWPEARSPGTTTTTRCSKWSRISPTSSPGGKSETIVTVNSLTYCDAVIQEVS